MKPEEEENPHQILQAKFIERFMYDYINEKLKTEKLAIQVDPEYEQMLRSLNVPMELNFMRTMKPDNYTKLRELIR